MGKYSYVYRGEVAPEDKGALWIHHEVFNDVSSPLVMAIYNGGSWSNLIINGGESSDGDKEVDPMLNVPLTFEAKVDNTKIYFVSNCLPETCSIDISADGGETWTEVTSTSWGEGEEVPIVTLNAGEKILVRGDNPSGLCRIQPGTDSYAPAGIFWIKGEAYVYGNIMSLLSKDEYESLKSVPSYAFYELFYGGNGYDGYWNDFSLFSHPTKKLLLPATILNKYCYSRMFFNCASMTTAPELPAEILTDNCYSLTFSGCSSLNYIKALFTTTPSDAYTLDWVYNVSDTGTFIKNEEATWDVVGDNGVPNGWTIQASQADNSDEGGVRVRLVNGDNTDNDGFVPYEGQMTFNDAVEAYLAGDIVQIHYDDGDGYEYFENIINYERLSEEPSVLSTFNTYWLEYRENQGGGTA